MTFQKTKIDYWLLQSVYCRQSHCREVQRWGVSSGTRDNCKCFLAYKKIKAHFQNYHIFFNTSKCAANYVISFEIYDGFIGQKILKLWRQESWPFGLNPAQISIPVQYKSLTAGLLYNDFGFTVWSESRKHDAFF